MVTSSSKHFGSELPSPIEVELSMMCAQVNHHANPYGVPQKPLPEAGSVIWMTFELEPVRGIPQDVRNHFLGNA